MTETARRLESPSIAVMPATDRQRRVWLVQSFDPDSPMYNTSASFRLRGDVNGHRLQDALAAVAERHEILRTTYQVDLAGTLQQHVRADLLPTYSQHDLTDLADQASRLRVEVLAQREFGTPFELAVEAPLRLTLIRVGRDEHVLLVAAHQIAWDDASTHVFLADLTAAYEDPCRYAERPLRPLTELHQAPARDPAADRRYWQTVLPDLPEPLELPGPNGSAVSSTLRADLCSRHVPADLVRGINHLAEETGSTPFAVMAAALSALIARYTQTDDFLIALPALDRSGENEAGIGYLGHKAMLRARVDAQMTFRKLAAQTHHAIDGALAHTGDSLDQLIREIALDGLHGGADRLARLSFAARAQGSYGFTPRGVRCERTTLRAHVAHLPLVLTVEFTADDAVIHAQYQVDVLDGQLVTRLLAHLEQLLNSAVCEPDTSVHKLDMLGSDWSWLQRVAAGDAHRRAPTTLTALVERQANASPDSVAVTYESRHYTYQQINEQANRLAHWLIHQEIGAEDLVAVLLPRSPELVVTALGIAKAGAAYLPIDPDYPAEKIDFILADSSPRLTLRQPVGGLDEFPDVDPTDDDRMHPLLPDHLAYVIYTSGSTGRPKGVAVSHAPVIDYLAWYGADYQRNTRESVLQLASTSFDASIEEIFGTLGNGARLVIPRPDRLRDVGYLTSVLEREAITAVHLVPSLLGLFLSLPGASKWRTLRRIPIGGEALPGGLADRFRATFDAPLHNFYGPTETTIAATRYRVTTKQGNRVVPIGRPKVNTTVHLLDNMLQPVPVGAIGEIYIGGTALARGYHLRPGSTAERFVADPYRAGGRMYRTGDLARRNGDGDLEFVGRADEQVKVNGHRIELGEIAAATTVDPSVGQCVVMAHDLPGSGRSLVAYLTPSADCDTVDVNRVRARVSAALPVHMQPTDYVVLQKIPITTHGKVDRDALRAGRR
ncbi:amino acid adenylation domain-containing protein [Mycobacterium sp. 1274761.0]|uniref:non-ribosomal peptide synthetase n=1 Tax=Mycobacterium sp. 1274761.0 TaxID=1834077 RepID=UPI001E579EBE|nr:amino acid adenylation domain-containing protein [Mycobacterium sp. 1274761.0]